MRVIIDGYNLLYAVGRLTPQSRIAALTGARRWLVNHLRENFRQFRDVIVVFDGPPGKEDSSSPEASGPLQTIFSRKQAADDVIEDLIARDSSPTTLMVVSNDHRIQKAARRRKCTCRGCLDFLEQLQQHSSVNPPSPAPADPSAKPETSTAEETQHWLLAFRDLDDDPLLRDPF